MDAHLVRALWFVQYHSIRNRLVMRIKRLKQPKYLFGALFGLAYVYFYFLRHFIGFGSQRPVGTFSLTGSPESAALFENLGALILFGFVFLGWVLPHERTALTFSEAEVAFLFPAPISRRGLIHYKLLRSQMAILFTILFLTLITNRLGGKAWIHTAGWWLILSMLNLHFLGSSFAITKLMDRGISPWWRRLGIFALLVVAGVAVFVWAKRTLPPLDLSQVDDFESAIGVVQTYADAGPAKYLLAPFRLVVRPYLAPDLGTFLRVVWVPLLMLVAHYFWVIWSNVAFEEASVEASKKLAERVASMRAGNWRGRNVKNKARPPAFPLRPTGLPAVALLWKNLLSIGRGFSAVTWFIFAGVAIAACIYMSVKPETRPLLIGVGMAAGMGIIWGLVLGPQVLRRDFRQDLPQADILKSFPLPGWQVALGEVLAPVFVLTRIEWLCLIPGGSALLVSPVPLTVPSKIAIILGALLVIPFLNLITIQIPNAAALLFPAWIQTGKEGAQGIEATGQRLMFMVLQLLVLMVVLVPGAGIFLVVLLVGKLVLPMALALLLGALGTSLVLAIEAGLGIWGLGKLFERFDVAAELSP